MTTKTPRPKVIVTEALIRDARESRTGKDFVSDEADPPPGRKPFTGTIHSSSSRVIIQAIKAAHPGARRVFVDLQSIRFSDRKKGLRFTYWTPEVVQRALMRMDCGNPVEPFAFDLEEPVRTSKAAAEAADK